jgi:uncharacterized protein (DUF1501 family)
MTPSRIATRREFLTHGLGLVGVGASLPNFLVGAALAGEPARAADGRILVVLLLSGGQDGPSCVVPYAHDGYAKVRKLTFIAPDQVLKLNDEVGFNPKLAGLKELYDQKRVAVIQGAGYPNPNYSHFESMDIWQAGDPRGKKAGSGWLGRYCDGALPGRTDPALMLAIGGGVAPLAITGKEHPGLSFHRPESFKYTGHRNDPERSSAYARLNSACEGNASLEFITKTAVGANQTSEKIRELAAAYKPASAFPTSHLGRSLGTVSALIAGNLGTRIYFVSLGGFDTHADQRGAHDNLMADLNASLMAFQADLAAQGNRDRVLVMTFSEFGRRPEENGSRGTDHGSAGPMLLIGPAVKAGVHGKHPSFEDLNPQKNFKHQVDFRSVYAAVLERWLGAPSRPVLGEGFPPLDCLA